MCLHVAAVGTITKTGAHALSGEALAIQLEAFGFLAIAGFVFLTKQKGTHEDGNTFSKWIKEIFAKRKAEK